jgi:hypothetical protein
MNQAAADAATTPKMPTPVIISTIPTARPAAVTG